MGVIKHILFFALILLTVLNIAFIPLGIIGTKNRSCRDLPKTRASLLVFPGAKLGCWLGEDLK